MNQVKPKGKEIITFDELRALGCPDELLMQYLEWTKDRITSEVLEKVGMHE